MDEEATDPLTTPATKELSVYIEPDSEELNAQTLLKRSAVGDFSFLIGRRGSIAENYYGRVPDFLIAEEEPFTISRHHCSIKRTSYGALIKDLESKTGVVVNGVRYGGRDAKETKVKLGPGVHSLILGSRTGKARFKLIIE